MNNVFTETRPANVLGKIKTCNWASTEIVQGKRKNYFRLKKERFRIILLLGQKLIYSATFSFWNQLDIVSLLRRTNLSVRIFVLHKMLLVLHARILGHMIATGSGIMSFLRHVIRYLQVSACGHFWGVFAWKTSENGNHLQEQAFGPSNYSTKHIEFLYDLVTRWFYVLQAVTALLHAFKCVIYYVDVFD